MRRARSAFSPGNRRTRLAALAGLAIGGLLALLLLRATSPAAPEPVAVTPAIEPPSSPAAIAPRPAEVAAAIAPAAAPAGTAPALGDRKVFNARKAAMTRDALVSVNDWINYPLWSARLTENMQYKQPVPFHTEATGPDGAAPKLELYPDKLDYAPGEPVRIVAVAHGAAGIVEFDALTGKTIGGVRTRPTVDLAWEPQPDHTFVATLAIPEDTAQKNRGDWGVMVDCEIEGEHRVATTQFREMGTDAKITGPYRVAVEEGSLSVYVTVQATAPSRQHLRGELWSTRGAPVAYAWVRNDETKVGASEMKLVFYGKTIRDSGQDGPYRIENLLLTTFDDNDDRLENPALDPDLETPAYARTMFTDTPVNADNTVLNEKKKVLEGELAKAESDGYDPKHYEAPPSPRASKAEPPPH